MLTKKLNAPKLLLTVILAVVSVVFLVPLIWMMSAASKFEQDVMSYPIQWIPTSWNFIGNFKEVWFGKVPFSLFYFNSLKLAIIMTLCTLVFSSMAAFAFTKMEFHGRNVAFGLLLSFMIIPAEATLVPRYILLKWLHLYNTHEGLILMNAFSVYFTFLLRQFMLSIHSEYIEAGRLMEQAALPSFGKLYFLCRSRFWLQWGLSNLFGHGTITKTRLSS